jgi:hypothetical protein
MYTIQILASLLFEVGDLISIKVSM